MEFYKTNTGTLVNLEKVTNICQIKERIFFEFGLGDNCIYETFKTEEEAKKRQKNFENYFRNTEALIEF